MHTHIEILEDVLLNYTFNPNIPEHLFINNKGEEKIFHINKEDGINAILDFEGMKINLGPASDIEQLRKNLYNFLLNNNIARKEDYIKFICNNLLENLGGETFPVEGYTEDGSGIIVSETPSTSKFIYEVDMYNVFVIVYEHGMEKNIYKEEYSNLDIETLIELYYLTNELYEN